MFFILSKILAFFVRPLTWIIALFLLSLLTKRKKLKKWTAISGVALLAFFSNQYISNRMMLLWEYEPVPIESLDSYDVGIVFSGVTRSDKFPQDRVYFNQGADRITHTLQLYRQGKIKHILVTGGLGFQQEEVNTAAQRLKSFLEMAGVPESAITVENDAVNTYENAMKSKEILFRDFPNQKYLLITSSFHMRRSLLCMNKQGVEVTPFPAGFLTGRSTLNFDDLFIPKSEAIDRWERLIKELVGMATYKVTGYI